MKTNVKRISLLLVVFMLIAVFATGCGSSKPAGSKAETEKAANVQTQTEKKEEAPKQEIVLKLLSQKSSWEEARNGELAKAFTAKTGIKIEPEIVPDGAEGENIIKTRYATNEMPDLQFYYTGGMMYPLNPEQNFLDLTNEPYMANIDDSFKKVATFKGKVYSIPQTPASFGVWFYNKKIYSDLGLQVPKTWAELMANCEKIKGAGKVPIVAPYKDSWTAQLIVLENHFYVTKANPTFSDDYTANKLKLVNVPEYIKGWERLQEVYKKGYLNKDFLSMMYDSGIKAFIDGTAAHFPMGSWVIPTIADKYPDKVNDIGAFAQPSDDPNVNGMTIWLPWGVYATKTGKNLDASKQFLEFYISKEGIAAYSSKVGPSGVFLVKGVEMPSNLYPSIADGIQYVNSGNVHPAMEFESPIKPASQPQICVEVGSGQITPIEGVKKMDNEGEKFAKTSKLPGW